MMSPFYHTSICDPQGVVGRQVAITAVAAAALAAACGVWALSGGKKSPPKPASAQSSAGVRILQFYAAKAVVTEGQPDLICYGVSSAESIRIDPPVEQLRPAANRCFEVRPNRDTAYTLWATGAQGLSVSESLTIKVEPDPELQPRVSSFSLNRQLNDKGKLIFSLCYQAQNAQEVTLDPPEVHLRGALMGCFYVSPSRTTTYRMIAHGAAGRTAERSLTVNVP